MRVEQFTVFRSFKNKLNFKIRQFTPFAVFAIIAIVNFNKIVLGIVIPTKQMLLQFYLIAEINDLKKYLKRIFLFISEKMASPKLFFSNGSPYFFHPKPETILKHKLNSTILSLKFNGEDCFFDKLLQV